MSLIKKHIENFSVQLEEALKIGKKFDLHRPGSDIRNVVISGMGASGISANLVDSLCFNRLPIPLTVCKGYELPRFVSPHTLFIACSYSGNTEETVIALKKAFLKRASIIVITSGGELHSSAKEHDLFTIHIPQDLYAPRFMIGHMIVALLSVFYHTNLIGGAFIKETENAIKNLRHNNKAIQAEARLVSKKLVDKFPVIYSDARLHAMGLRFQQQLNENARQIAHVNIFPEMNHNELSGWQNPQSVIPTLQAIYLHSDHDHPQVRRRMKICGEIFEKVSKPVIHLKGEGGSLLEQYYFLINLTDWISYFLSLENKVNNLEDPINFVKSELLKPGE